MCPHYAERRSLSVSTCWKGGKGLAVLKFFSTGLAPFFSRGDILSIYFKININKGRIFLKYGSFSQIVLEVLNLNQNLGYLIFKVYPLGILYRMV